MVRKKNRFWISLAIASLALLAGCAQIRGLEGGVKDTEAPKVVSVYPPQLTTRFQDKEIIIEFDEYVEVQNLAQELIVSPPLLRPLKTKIKKKTVSFTIQEELLPNTTYTFNFGSAIVDFHEANKSSLIYVVSTGEVIDSLRVRAMVTDAWTGKPVEGAKVMLFPDSVGDKMFRRMPYYFTRSIKDGSAEIPYLPSGKFRLAVLNDTQDNYLPDPEETMAVLDSLIEGSADSAVVVQALALAHNWTDEVDFSDVKLDSAGILRMKYPHYMPPVVVSSGSTGLTTGLFRDFKSDSVMIWLKGVATDREESVIIQQGDSLADTLFIPFYRSIADKAIRLFVRPEDRLRPGDTISLRLSVPVLSVNAELVSLQGPDSAFIPLTVAASSLRPDEIRLAHGPLARGVHRLLLLPGAVKGESGNTNDSILHVFTVPTQTEFAALNLDVSTSVENCKFRMQFRNVKRGVEWEGQTSFPGKWKGENILPGDYELRIWCDQNENGRWDEARWKDGVQPERIWVYPEPVSLRANWEQQIQWKFE